MLTILQCPDPWKSVWLKYKLSNIRPLKMSSKPCLLHIIVFSSRKCHSLNLKMDDDVLSLLLSLHVFEVIFRTNEWQVRTAWLGMTNEVTPLVVCPHPTLAAGCLKSPHSNSSIWSNNCITHLFSPSLTGEVLNFIIENLCVASWDNNWTLALMV